VRLIELRVQNLRNIEELQLDLGAGLNQFVGPNGAGKTSILEAAHLLSHGSSFRTHQSDHLLRRGADQLSVFGQVETCSGVRRLGLQRGAGRWSAKLDGQSPAALTSLFDACAVVCFEPGSHALISGPSELRRSFLDWGVFHVEPEFADQARRYRRALRQRNALLKQEAREADLIIWEEELAQTAQPIAQSRETYIERFGAELLPLFAAYLPELGQAFLRFRPGWDRDLSLLQVLTDARARDRARGHTTRGPHRADWTLSFAQAPTHEQLSRGQEKLCAIACMLAQARLYQRTHAEWPIIALDDLCSELDVPHQAAVMDTLTAAGTQILLTGTEIPPTLVDHLTARRRFHVEQGRVQALL
jgi:DNA replication and repair protein RecF